MRHRRWFLALGLLFVALVAFVAVWFQPHKLFVDDEVDEAIPTVAAPDDTRAAETTVADPGSTVTSTTTTAPPEPVDLARGTFVSLDHGTTGTARVIQLSDGSRYLRFEGFETSNGPDVFVYLSPNPADGPEGEFDVGYVDLGRMKGNVGDQNYELPADLDLSAYASVVIWCDRFDSAFGAADLAPA